MKKITKLLVAIALTLATTVVHAQSNSSKQAVAGHCYHLLFQSEEVDGGGKVANTRDYTTTICSGDAKPVSIRSGSRIPVATNTGKGDITYLDLGFEIDAEDAVETGNELQLSVKAVLSTVASTANSLDPVIRQNTWSAKVIVPVGKPTMIFSSDNLENKGKTRLEVTATRID